MKRITLLLAVCGMLLTSCKKETVVEQTTTVNADGSTVTTTRTTTDYDMKLKKAEADYNDAERNLKVARESGDTKAERVAQEAADKAKIAWEKTKETLKEAGDDTKDAYNRTLERAKAK